VKANAAVKWTKVKRRGISKKNSDGVTWRYDERRGMMRMAAYRRGHVEAKRTVGASASANGVFDLKLSERTAS